MIRAHYLTSSGDFMTDYRAYLDIMVEQALSMADWESIIVR